MQAGLAVLLGLAVSSGPNPYAGDGPRLATVSPNGDGLRDAAVVSFRLTRPASVRLEAVRTDTIRVGRPLGEAIWARAWRLRAGAHRLTWRPAAATPPRTYVLRLTVRAGGVTRVYGARRPGRQDAPVVRVQGIDAGFTERSYAPGEAAQLGV